MDGSLAAWLEARGPRGCLTDLVDDASGVTLAQRGEEETTWAAADCLRAWVEQYGIPAALYTDWKNVYLRAPTQEQLQGQEPLTQFGRRCAKLGIRMVGASSPQAKGRWERTQGAPGSADQAAAAPGGQQPRAGQPVSGAGVLVSGAGVLEGAQPTVCEGAGPTGGFFTGRWSQAWICGRCFVWRRNGW